MTVWLPVARMPAVCQVSLIVRSATGNYGEPADGLSVRIHLRGDQDRPVVVQDTGAIWPGAREQIAAFGAYRGARGREDRCQLGAGISPNTSSRAAWGNFAASRLEPLMSLTTHEVDGQ